MKTFTIITTFAAAAASLLALTTPAAAQEATYDVPQAVVSTQSRADVMAQTAKARADGVVFSSEIGQYDSTPAVARAGSLRNMRAPVLAKGLSRGERSTLVALQFEPQSFDGSISAANGAVSVRNR